MIELTAMLCVALNVYHEARSEPLMSQVAHAQVVIQRTENPDFPDSECEVVTDGGEKRWRCQFTWYCDGRSDIPFDERAWSRAKNVASLVLERKLWLPHLEGVMHYHADYVSPDWGFVRVAQIGRTIFFRRHGES